VSVAFPFEARFRHQSSRLRNTGIGAVLCGLFRILKESIHYLGLWLLDGKVVIDWRDMKDRLIVALAFGAVVGAFWRVRKPTTEEPGPPVISSQPIAPE
jgi:hypothetical protein